VVHLVAGSHRRREHPIVFISYYDLLAGTDRFVSRRAKQFWMQIAAAILGWLFDFYGTAVSVCVDVVPNPGHLPGHFQTRSSSRDPKTVVLDLSGNVDRRETPNTA
jgi:hypothetical protein